ncbi:hypothetical protein K458DRAFT_477532 [Lentithecium fluviatile CBS 122367]|uniref:RNI-like protein n=1 Tax=Lentithecium fluviatile CBS 122367 TaxID=1168545 RepID=A0A6G1J3Y8_9PLEO|nr:hypothetical protein K458DRAFT_477532 [Lentithecium fluviatile CBS 122367]
MTNRHIVSTILHHLSGMKYKDRRQYGPDQPVEFLEFRPTLVPSILVNRLWADEGTSILWRRYPHLPAFKKMPIERRQYYAIKVQHVFALSPPPGSADSLDYLEDLAWPNLKSLELEVDFKRHGANFASMLHTGLENLEISGLQSGDSNYFSGVVLPALFNPCKGLKSLRIGADTIPDDEPVHVGALFDHLDAIPSIKTIEVKSTNFIDKDALFARLSQRPDLEGLEIDLDPGLALLPLLSGPNALPSPFSTLKRAWIMCYPEVALALPTHLGLIEEFQLDIARIPNRPSQDSDYSILDDLLAQMPYCPHLRLLKIGVGMMAENFPSIASLPKLTGGNFVTLAESCSKLEDVNLLAADPSAIDGSSISSEEFDSFCRALPHLRVLNLKLHPITSTSLENTALLSLGQHCPELEVIRLKIPFQLPILPVPNTIPQILIHDEDEFLTTGYNAPSSSDDGKSSARSSLAVSSPSSQFSSSPVTSLFPRLTHLAVSRPQTALATLVSDAIPPSSPTMSSSSYSTHSVAEIVDPEVEEFLVRSWAHPLLTHFPRLEILEAWGDWTGQDNESLNYFLPMDEILASTWEFLSGVEQDLWEDDEHTADEVEDDNWRQSWESSEDWEKASLINEFRVDEGVGYDKLHVEKLGLYDEEPEGMITPGRTMKDEGLFRVADSQHQGGG